MKTSFLAFLFLFGFLTSQAQHCYLYYVTGEVSIKTDKKLVSAKSGDSFSEGQSLILGNGALLSVLNRKGQEVLFNKRGTYSYSNVKSEIAKSDQTTGKFFAYIWEQFNHHHNESDKNEMKASGGISRSDAPHLLEPLDSGVIIGTAIQFTWQYSESPATLTVYDLNNEVLKVAVSDSTVTLYPFSSKLTRGKYYSWTITNGAFDAPALKQIFFLPDKTWQDQYHHEEEILKSTLSAFADPMFMENQLRLFKKSKRIVDSPSK